MTILLLSQTVGAQIIDLMLLVVDATKGMQTQTAEVMSTKLADFKAEYSLLL